MTIHGELVIHTISIHSLRMEGDIRFDEILNPKWAFQSTPSAWRETESRGVLSVSERFQSTPSAWRETFRLRTSLDHQHISIHSLRMEGDIHRTNHGRRRIISIHSLRMEGDHLRQADTVHVVYFNPLPPHGGRLPCAMISPTFCVISIHSLRMEGDRFRQIRWRRQCHFNPLPPHGGRLALSDSLVMQDRVFQSTPSAWRETFFSGESERTTIFQSTPSAWRETTTSINSLRSAIISIHSLRMEGDPHRNTGCAECRHFNPLPPHGGRRTTIANVPRIPNFNPLPPHGGRPGDCRHSDRRYAISIHSLRMEGD